MEINKIALNNVGATNTNNHISVKEVSVVKSVSSYHYLNVI